MGEFSKYCDDETNEREDAITSAARTINEASAAEEDASGSIASLTAEAEELASKISANEADLSSATYIRDDERKAFEAAEAELLETVDTLGRALVVLKRGQTGFMQTKSKDLELLSSTLSKVVRAAWVSAKDKSKVQSLLQSEDEDLSLQPQATASAYESKGSGIVDTLGDLKDKAESSLSDQRKAEMESSHAYQMLKQNLDTEAAQMKKRLTQVTNERSQTEEAMHEAQAEQDESSKSKATDEAYLADLKQSCATKAAEWSQRQKSASEEIGVIEKAKEILSEGVKVFLQVSRKTDDKDDELKRSQIATVLRNLATKHHAYQLSQLSAEVLSDPFGKVRGLIEGMVERLMKEAAEEAESKSFCDKEISKSRAKQADLSAKVDMHTARIEKSTAAKAKLGEQIKALQAEIAEIDKSNSEPTELRTAEKAEYDKASAEYSQSAAAVANAIEVLQAYYSGGAFVQVRSVQPEFGSAKSDVGNTIVEMLEVAESDFTRLLAEANASENAAAAAYEDLTQKNAVARAAKVSEVKGKSAEVKSLDMNLLNYKDDRESTGKELDAVLAYLDKLKPQCETKVMSYAERKARREDEIAGLKEALAILSDETAFVQVSTSLRGARRA